ncbi:MAG TPA: hypothetical protein VFZ12_03315, partial [Dehalococcoidia bacterium]|nr:hypothetical protein [Dehalococcoidia bacterium]
ASILPDQATDGEATADGDPAAARFRLFTAVAGALRAASNRRPVLILLDDLHLADEPSLLLLRFISSDREQGRVALMGAFRNPDTEAAPEWRPPAILLELARQPQVETIHVGGLDATNVADFIVATTGRDAEQNLVHQVHEETEGNPLVMGEIVRLLEYEGRLAPGQPLDLLATRLPPTVSETISRRLRHISTECRSLLALASVLGRDFDLGVLAALKGRPRQDLDPLLREAARARLILDVAAGAVRCRFSHALIRDVLYQTIPVERRRAIHLAAGNALEALYHAEPEEHLAELAFHYVSSADATRRDRGIEYARRAANRAVDHLAFEEGVRLYRLALDTAIELAPSDLHTRGELLLALGDAQARSGDTAAAQRSFMAAADVARRLGDATVLARAALGYGGRLVWATPRGDPNLIPLLREALAAVEDAGLRCRVLARLSGALREDFEVTERDRLSREAVEVARTLDDPSALAYALSARYPAVWGPDNLDERFAIGSELLAVGLEAVDRERIFHGHTQRLYVELERGDMAAAREDFAGAARIARELSQPSQLWLVGAIEAELAIFEGRLVDAERLAYRAHALGLRASRSSADIAFAMQLFVLRREQERLPEVAELVQATIDSYASSYPVLFALEVLAAAELGDVERARSLLESLSRDEFAALPRNDEWLPALTLVAEALTKLPDVATPARWLYETTQGYYDRNVLGNPELLYGSHARTLGLLALKMGEVEVAIDHLQQAVTANRSWGGVLWASWSQSDLAAALIDRSDEGERERVRSLLNAIGEASASLPSRRLETEVSRLTHEIGRRSWHPAARREAARSLFRREGDSWHIEFEGRTLRLKDTLG